MTLRPDKFVLTFACGALLLSGCATKKYVRETVSPVDTHVGEVEKAANKNSEDIKTLDNKVDRDVSRLEERVTSVMGDAKVANDKAVAAQQSADQASQEANEARTYAENGLNQVTKKMADMATYRQSGKESVMFDFNSAQISDEGKEKLANIAQSVEGKKTFVIEVQGYTDSTGDPVYNLGLSERRAENVVRALTARFGVPLRSIHRVGLGEIEGENTKEARTMNRRVDITVWVPLSQAGVEVSQN